MTQISNQQERPWLKSYDKGVPANVDYEDTCLPDMLTRSAGAFPNQMALLFQGYKVNYQQLKVMVDRFATALDGFGVKKGDRVAILLPNLIPCVVAYYGILKVGGIAVMNNPLYSDRELKHQFNDSGAKLLITLDLLGNRMIDLRAETGVKQIIYTSIGDYLPFPKSLLFPLVAKKKKLAANVKPASDLYKWKEVIASNDPKPPQVSLSFS
ncbi:MAG: AMP-binding protein, partial [Deltaproteobacteria bacterium]|nr:AMP-binding protein [Deltaproteobacteria bacterium]